ncbi:MAG: NAAT family transporter [Alphaproteobacteria bacterium]|nr:NAAT family transporter [Alphaproteobacteria bacterium]
MTELFISALVTFFVVIDPPGCAPIFASLTNTATQAQRRVMAIRATLVAAAVLLFFALLGEPLLKALGISLDSFRIAGGVMLFLIAIDMVFETRTQRREKRADEIAREADGKTEPEDVSVFPMAIPMIAGPGSIASVMLMTARSSGTTETLVVLGALGTILLLTCVSLIAAGPLLALMGRKLEAMITRLLGVILAALAAQFIVDGIKLSFGL